MYATRSRSKAGPGLPAQAVYDYRLRLYRGHGGFRVVCQKGIKHFLYSIDFFNMEEPMYPEAYRLFFHHNVCHVCKTTCNLKRCSNCKSIAYCSKDHQKLDWRHHKKFCSAMTKANAECEFIALTNFDDFLTVKKMKYRLLCEYLKRRLFNHEDQMWMFPRFCEICFSSNINVECEKCGSVVFCSEDHKLKFTEQHKRSCDALLLNRQIGLFPISNPIKDITIVVSDIPKSIEILPSHFKELVELYDKHSVLGTDDLMQRIRKLNCLSPIASILYGLEKSGFITDRKYIKDELTIHIVGGSMYEIGRLWRHMAELGFHWIENLVQLDFIIIGPELDCNHTTDKFSYQLCLSCQNRKCKTRCTFHTQLYHDVVNQLKKPDVVVAFNSGIHGTETQHFLSNDANLPEYLWKDSIEYLVHTKNIPLILTTYTLEELERDIAEVKNHAKSEVKTLIEPHRNPFSDGKPLRNFESQIEPVFYINGYMSVLTRI